MEGNVKQYTLRRKDLLYPELSFEINGVLIDVSKKLGGGHKEKYYEDAIAIGLEKKEIKFVRQYYVPMKYEGTIIGKYFLDFLIADKIILELKRGQFVPIAVIEQTKQYLSALNLKLGVIACFTHSGVVIKRIPNEQ